MKSEQKRRLQTGMLVLISIAGLGGSTGAFAQVAAQQLAKSWQTNTDPDRNGQITVGDTLNYWVRIQNQGTVNLTNVVVSDPLITPNSITCASVSPGLSCSLFGNYTVTVSDESAGSINNTGSVTSNEIPGPVTINVRTPVVTRTTGMTVSKVRTANNDADGNGRISVGDTLTYRVQMANTGNQPLNNVVVSDPRITPNSITCASVNGSGICSLIGTYTVTASDASAGSITNTGSASSNEIPGPISSTVITPVSSPAMTLSKSVTFNTDPDANGQVTVGDQLSYTLQAFNTGNVVLNNIRMTDPLKSPTPFCGPGAPIPVGNGGSCTFIYTVTAADEGTGSITNTGSATTSEIPSPTFSNTLVTPVITRTTGMTVNKNVTANSDPDGNGQVTVGDILTYRVRMFATGNQPLTNVVVSDPLLTPNSITCPTVTFNSGRVCDLIGTYKVTSADATAGSITNTGSASSNEIPGPITSTVRTPVVTLTAGLTVAKTLTGNADGDRNNQVSVGDVLTYSVKASNSGSVVLTNVVVDDPLTTPSSITCASLSVGASCSLSGTYTVTAGDASAGGITNTGSATSTQVPGPITSALTTQVQAAPAQPSTSVPISGTQQSLAPGVASAPLVVEFRSNGAPLVGKTISWTTTGGTLAFSTTITDANGRTSNTVTISVPGSVVVTATFAGTATVLGSSLRFTLNNAIATVPGLSPTQLSVATALDSACASLQGASTLTPAQQDLLNQCQALRSTASAQAVANALQELLPDVALVQSQSGQLAATAQFDNINRRMSSLRGGTYGSSLAGLSLVGPGASVSLTSLGAALMGDEVPAAGSQSFERWGLFASGSIGRAEAEPGRETPAYDFDINGLTVGVDYRRSDHWVLGAALGLTRQDSTLSGQQGSLDTSGWSVSGYSTWYQGDSWYIDSLLSYGRNSYDHRRRIVFSLPLPGGSSFDVDQIARGSSSGSDLSASTTFGRDFHKAAWTLALYARGLYSRLGFAGFRETLDSSAPGGGLALAIEDRTVTALSSVLGAKASYAHSTSWGVLMPHVDLEWQREYRSDPESFRALFVNDPTGTPILVTGDGLDNSYLRVGVGLSMVLTHGRSGFVSYVRTVGRDGISQDNLALGFRMEF